MRTSSYVNLAVKLTLAAKQFDLKGDENLAEGVREVLDEIWYKKLSAEEKQQLCVLLDKAKNKRLSKRKKTNV